MKRSIAIVNYNTPEMTKACICSLRKHMCDWPVYVFDNSDEKPFTAKMWNVTVFDNTKGQLVDFEKELAKYPDRIMDDQKFSNFGSSKHQWSVQKLWELLPEGFILVESDVLITRDIRWMWNERYAAVGKVQRPVAFEFNNDRLLPMLCYMNVPLLLKHGAKYFDPKRTYLLFGNPHIKENYYDTGAVLLEDIRRTKPGLVAQVIYNLEDYYIHFMHASWKNKAEESKFKNQEKDMEFWLQANKRHWELPRREVKSQKTCLFAMGRRENRYALEFVEHHKKCGFDKIYIFDNNREGEEKFEDVLGKHIKSGFVEIIVNRNRVEQNQVYMDFYHRVKDEYQWIAFFDFDELLWLPKGLKIGKLMERAGDADCMLVNWQIMTDNGLVTYDKRKMATRFTQAADENVKRADGVIFNHHTKCIVRGGIDRLKFNNPHFPAEPTLRLVNSEGEPVSQSWKQFIPKTDVRLRHYMTKTIEEYITNKAAREFPLSDFYNEVWAKYAMENFWIINERTPEKEEWLKTHSKP